MISSAHRSDVKCQHPAAYPPLPPVQEQKLRPHEKIDMPVRALQELLCVQRMSGLEGLLSVIVSQPQRGATATGCICNRFHAY